MIKCFSDPPNQEKPHSYRIFFSQLSIASITYYLRDVSHFHMVTFLTPPLAFCHFRRCLKHEKTDRHSFCSQMRGVRDEGKIWRASCPFSQQIIVCVNIFEYVNLSIISGGLHATQTIS